MTWRGLFETGTCIENIHQIPMPVLPARYRLFTSNGRRQDMCPTASTGRLGLNGGQLHVHSISGTSAPPTGGTGAGVFGFAPVNSDRQNAHRTVLAFASDRSLLAAISHTRGEHTRGIVTKGASLDHTMWFHSDVSAGGWLLYAQSSPFSTQRTGVAQGHTYDRSGLMVASVMQQAIRSGP